MLSFIFKPKKIRSKIVNGFLFFKKKYLYYSLLPNI